jgi:hypothetical protein
MTEDAFLKATLDICKRASEEINYRASGYLGLVEKHGAIGAAKYVINADPPAEGFTRLWEAHLLKLSTEVLVVEHPEFHPLFTPQEIARALQRLTEYGYLPRNTSLTG